MKTELLVAIIEASSIILASVITGAALLFSAYAVYSKKQLRRKLITALNDLYFFQSAEDIHVGMEVGRNDLDNKVMVRKKVTEETGFIHSGMSRSIVRRELQRLQSID